MVDLRLQLRKWRAGINTDSKRFRSIHNAGWLVADKLIRIAVGLFVNVYIARALGPAIFGSLSYAQALVMMFLAISSMGLMDVNVRDFVRYPDRADTIAASAFVLRLGGAALALSLCVVMTLLLSKGNDNSLILVIALGVMYFAQAMDVLDARFQANGMFRPIVIIRNISFLVASALKCGVIVCHGTVLDLAVVMTAELFFTAVGIFIYAARNNAALSLRNVSLAECVRQLSVSWSLLIRQIFIGVYMRIDQVMLGHLLDDRAVGVYAAASRISEMTYLIPMSMMTAVNPHLTRSHKETPHQYDRHLVEIMRALTYFAVFVAIVTGLLAPVFIHLLYGAKYSQSAVVLTIHIWAGVFVALGTPASAWFINAGLTRYGLLQAAVGAVVGVLANFLLIPRMGLVGAAYALLLSQFVSAFAINVMFRSTRPIFFLQLRALTFDKLRPPVPAG